jgi:hypothetical protein
MYVRWKRRQLTGTFLQPTNTFHGHTEIELDTPEGGSMRVRMTTSEACARSEGGRRYTMIRYHVGMHSQTVASDVERHSYHASLVKSVRVAGKPRQQTVAYLGSYQDGDPERPDARVAFWRHLEKRLASLPVSDEVKQRVREALAVRMPQPLPQEELQARERERLYAVLLTGKDAGAKT